MFFSNIRWYAIPSLGIADFKDEINLTNSSRAAGLRNNKFVIDLLR